jgi:N-acetyl-1-D-myo-inositol-2-amino-2-deoxy-alpha-D-glucopyranoside deacetylase
VFSDGDLEEQTAHLVAIIRNTRPQVLVTYDERGGYGHPDHIRAHEVSVAAFEAAGDGSSHPTAGPPWAVAKLYAAVVPHSSLRRAAQLMAETTGVNPFTTDGEPLPDEALPFGVPDEAVTAQIDAREWTAAKAAAMRAHRSQAEVNSWFFTLVDDPARGFGVEHFRLLRGTAAPAGAGEREDDLFAGLR